MRFTITRLAGTQDRLNQVIRLKHDHEIPRYYSRDLNSVEIKHLKQTTKSGLFQTYNRDKLKQKNVIKNVDKVYSEFIKLCNYDIDAFASTTPFNRK